MLELRLSASPASSPPSLKRPAPSELASPPAKRHCAETAAWPPQGGSSAGLRRLPVELLEQVAAHLGPTDRLSWGRSRLHHGSVFDMGPLRAMLRELGYPLAIPPESEAGRRGLLAQLRRALEGEHRIERRIRQLWPPSDYQLRAIDGSQLTQAAKTHFCGQLLLARHPVADAEAQPGVTYRYLYLHLASRATTWRELPIEREPVVDWLVESKGDRLAVLSRGASRQTVRLIDFLPDRPAHVAACFKDLNLGRIRSVGRLGTLVGLPPAGGTEFLRFDWPAPGGVPASMGAPEPLPGGHLSRSHLFSRDGRFLAYRMQEPYVHIYDRATHVSFVHSLPHRLQDQAQLHFSADGRRLLEVNAQGVAYVLTLSDDPAHMWRCERFKVSGQRRGQALHLVDVSGDDVLYMTLGPTEVAYGLARVDGQPLGALCYQSYAFAHHHTLRLSRARWAAVRPNRHRPDDPAQCGLIDFNAFRPHVLWPVGPEHPGRAWALALWDAQHQLRHVINHIEPEGQAWRSQLFPIAASSTLTLAPEAFGLPPDTIRVRLTSAEDEQQLLVELSELPWDRPPLSSQTHRHTKAFVLTCPT